MAGITDVKVLGMGCANCHRTQALIEDVAKSAGIPITIEKVEDPQQFVTYGVMRTPGVVIDGRLVHAGGVPLRDAVLRWLAGVDESRS